MAAMAAALDTDPQQEAEQLDLSAALRDFEARCDKSDPQQVELLQQMRDHTRRLQRAEWGRPGNTRRNWNAATPTKATKPDESLRCVPAGRLHGVC